MNNPNLPFKLPDNVSQSLNQISSNNLLEFKLSFKNGKAVLLEITDKPPNVNKFKRIQELVTSPYQSISLKMNGGKELAHIERITRFKF
jgi:hypothetical protein